jgi:hypothetical protein
MKNLKKLTACVAVAFLLAAQSCGSGGNVTPQTQANVPEQPATPTNPSNPTNPTNTGGTGNTGTNTGGTGNTGTNTNPTPPASPVPLDDCGVKNPLEDLVWLKSWIAAKKTCTDTLTRYKCLPVRTPYILVHSYQYKGKLVYEINECPSGICDEMKIIPSISYIPNATLYNCKGEIICPNPTNTANSNSPCADFMQVATNKTLIYKNF